jgi:hypothetical protein
LFPTLVPNLERLFPLDVLLTFTGFHDPYAIGLIGQEEQPGPILSLVETRSFDHLVLFSTPNTEKHTRATEKALRALHPHLQIVTRDLVLDDPTDYVAIMRGLRAHVREICGLLPKARYFIAWHLGHHKCTRVGCCSPRAEKFLPVFFVFDRIGL